MGERYLDAVEAGGSKPPVPTSYLGKIVLRFKDSSKSSAGCLIGLGSQQEDKISALKADNSIPGIFPKWWGCLFLLRAFDRNAELVHRE